MPVKKRSFRPGEIIVALRPEMLQHPLAFGYAAPALQLLAMLRNNFGAVVKTLWPVGVDVLTPSPAPLPPGLPPYVAELEAAGAAMFRKELLDGLEWLGHGILTRSRLRLHVTLADPGRVEAALSQILESPAVLYAEAVPLIVAPKLVAKKFGAGGHAPMGLMSMGRPEPPVKQDQGEGKTGETTSVVGWQLKAIGRPLKWDGITMNNIAVLDSGFDSGHIALPYSAVNYGTAESTKDNYGHGTFICGTLVGRPGIARNGDEPPIPMGLFPTSRVWTMKVLVANKGTHELDAGRYSLALNVLAEADFSGMNMAKTVTRPPVGVQVVNLSLWSGSKTWKTEATDVARLQAKGVLVVASAGNAEIMLGAESPVTHPAALPWAISVGAYEPSGDRWANTNILPPEDTSRDPAIDLYAPGSKIYAALPMKPNELGQTFAGGLEGTSMAAPFVTACAAALRAKNPLISRDEVVKRLRGPSRMDAENNVTWYPLAWQEESEESE